MLSLLTLLAATSLHGQAGGDPDGPPPFRPGPGPDGPGPGGPGPMRSELKLVQQFDRNGDKRLDRAERNAAREFVQKERASRPPRRGPGRGPGGPGGPGRGGASTPPSPGLRVSPSQVTSFTNTPLYDPMTVRTLFLQFEQDDWEKELADFHNTDVEIPAQLTVDGQTYREVGVHFRGASSFMMLGEGSKRSLNVSLDFVDEDQRLYGHRTLNLLNSHEDPTFLRTVLYSHIARTYIAAPAANFVRVVINGESWGIYVSAEQFNKDFTKDRFGSTHGARWKAPGRPNGDAGLAWLGEDPAEYKRRFEIKSKDDSKSWARLIELCRVLEQTPPDRLEAALAPLLDVDGTLRFLAIENALVNNDGYWVRASDYSLYLDEQGRFHLIPHDTNETFSRPGGPGFGRGPGGRRFGPPPGSPPGPDQGPPDISRSEPSAGPPGPPGPPGAVGNGVDLDPLVAAKDSSKPLLSKLLAVPALRARYFSYLRDIASKWLDWQTLGPLAQRYQSIISAEVKADTRKLDSFEDFINGVAGATPAPPPPSEPGQRRFRGPGPKLSLRSFAEQRRTYLLNHAEVKKAPAL